MAKDFDFSIGVDGGEEHIESCRKNLKLNKIENSVKLFHEIVSDKKKFGYYHLFQGIIPKYYTRDPSKSYEENWGLFKGRKVIPSHIVISIIKFNHIVSNKYNKIMLLIKRLKPNLR